MANAIKSVFNGKVRKITEVKQKRKVCQFAVNF